MDLQPLGDRLIVEVLDEECDEIIFSKYGGTEIKIGADDVLILRESDVLAKVVTTGGKGKRKLAGAAA
jgi:co-chaperonin GroES (HSP10)